MKLINNDNIRKARKESALHRSVWFQYVNHFVRPPKEVWVVESIVEGERLAAWWYAHNYDTKKKPPKDWKHNPIPDLRVSLGGGLYMWPFERACLVTRERCYE